MAEDEELEGDALLLAEHEDVAVHLIDLPPAKEEDGQEDVRSFIAVVSLWSSIMVVVESICSGVVHPMP